MRSVLAAGLVLFISSTAAASAAPFQELEPRHRAAIERLMEVTGSQEMGLQMAQFVSSQLLHSFQDRFPEIEPQALAIVQEITDEEIAGAFKGSGGLLDGMIPLYARHFSLEEIEQLLAFYETEIGRKTIALMPTLAQEGAILGQQWMEERAPLIRRKVEERLKAEGLIH